MSGIIPGNPVGSTRFAPAGPPCPRVADEHACGHNARPVKSRALSALPFFALLLFGTCDRPPPAPLPPVAISWEPAAPTQGHLFRLRVAVPPEANVAVLTGAVAGETLHFETTASAQISLAAVPIDATDSIDAWVRATWLDGRERTDSLRIPVVAGRYRHERLTVAPRFGAPPSEADRARLVADRENATRVTRAARITPRLWSDRMVLPRSSRVTSGFGTGREFNGRIASRHMGLDLQGLHGDTVRAAADGVVALLHGFLLAGNTVSLNHGAGLVSSYSHLSAYLVEEGDTVVAGTPIGRVGATGRVTGPHLHWVVRFGDTSVAPRSLLALVR